MGKIDEHANVMRHIGGIEREMPTGWNVPARWADAVQHVANVLVDVRRHLNPHHYAGLLTVAALAHRQCKNEQALQAEESGEPLEGRVPYIWISDAPCDGWDVQVPEGPNASMHDRWFQIRRDAQLFADGMHSARGWPIVDDSTAPTIDETEEAEKAAQAVDEFFRGAKNGGGAA